MEFSTCDITHLKCTASDMCDNKNGKSQLQSHLHSPSCLLLQQTHSLHGSKISDTAPRMPSRVIKGL